MFIPYNVDVPMPRWPIANWVLMAVTCMASLAFLGDTESNATWMLFRGREFSPPQLITHMFAHADILHLAGNMLFLFVFGNAVNARLGHVLFLLVYFILGTVAGLGWMVAGEGEAALGASGAIMGIVGAFLVYYPRNDISVFYWFGFIAAGTFQVSSYWIILLYIAFDIWGLVAKGEGVAYIAHLGGAAAGFGVAAAFVATGLVKPGPGEQTIFQAMRGEGRERDGRPRRGDPGRKPSTPLRPPPEASRGSGDRGSLPLAGRGGPDAPKPKAIQPPPGGWR